MKLVVVLVLVLSTLTLNAGVISIDYQVTNNGYISLWRPFSEDENDFFGELDNWYIEYSYGSVFVHSNDRRELREVSELSELSELNGLGYFDNNILTVNVYLVEEPASLLFLGLGVTGIWFFRKRKRIQMWLH